MRRMIAADTSIPADQVEDAYHGEMGADAQARVGQAYGMLSGYRNAFVVDQRATMSPEQIRARVVKWKPRNLDMLIVDHLQLTSGRDDESRVNQLDKTTRELKSLAKELDLAVLALSQLNRNAERTNGKPTLSDLRDSGAIEQNSDVVLMLHAPVVKDARQDPDLPVKVLCLVAKNRNGGTGELGFASGGLTPDLRRRCLVRNSESGRVHRTHGLGTPRDTTCLSGGCASGHCQSPDVSQSLPPLRKGFVPW